MGNQNEKSKSSFLPDEEFDERLKTPYKKSRRNEFSSEKEIQYENNKEKIKKILIQENIDCSETRKVSILIDHILKNQFKKAEEFAGKNFFVTSMQIKNVKKQIQNQFPKLRSTIKSERSSESSEKNLNLFLKKKKQSSKLYSEIEYPSLDESLFENYEINQNKESIANRKRTKKQNNYMENSIQRSYYIPTTPFKKNKNKNKTGEITTIKNPEFSDNQSEENEDEKLKSEISKIFKQENIKLRPDAKNSFLNKFIKEKDLSLFKQIIPKNKTQSVLKKVRDVSGESLNSKDQTDRKLKELIHEMCNYEEGNQEQEKEILFKLKDNQEEEIINDYVAPINQKEFKERLLKIMETKKQIPQRTVQHRSQKQIIKELSKTKQNFLKHLHKQFSSSGRKITVQFEEKNISFEIDRNQYNFHTLISKIEEKIDDKIENYSLCSEKNNQLNEITKKNFQNTETSFKLYEKYPYKVLIEEEEWKINFYKKLSFEQQQILLESQLKPYLKGKYSFLFQFRRQKHPLSLQNEKDSIISLERKKGKIQFIEILLTYEIYVEGVLVDVDENFSMNSNQTIFDLKKKISLKHTLTFDAIDLFLVSKNGENIELHNNTKICHKELKYQNIFIQLHLKVDLQHYGFHQNRKITSNEYLMFFRETEETEKLLIEYCKPEEPQKQNQFLSVFLKFCFSAIKKGFSIQTIIKNYQAQLTKKSSASIWKNQNRNQPLTFNSLFVFMFILYNCDEKARAIIMNQAKSYLPLPIYFRNFKSIQEVSTSFTMNKQIQYILTDGFTIVSFGLHRNVQRQGGKTEFLSKVFYSQMVLKSNRHAIFKGCSFIYLNVLEDIFPLHLIDIPFDCPKSHLQQILKCANLVIIHSWLDERETHEELNLNFNFDSEYKIYYRDREQMVHLDKAKSIKKSEETHLPNLQNYERTDLIYLNIREQLLNQIKILSEKERLNKIYQLFSDEKLKVISKFLNQIQKNIFKLNVVGREIQKYENNGKNNFENHKKIIIKKGLHPLVKDLFIFLYRCSEQERNFLWIFFRSRMKEIRIKCDKPFYILFELEKKILNIDFNDDIEKRKFEQMCLSLKNLPLLKAELSGISLSIKQVKNNQNKFHDNIQNLIRIYEDQIKPNIFSLQLLWRELVGVLKCDQNYEIDNIPVKNIFIQMKKEQLKEQQPFQIIDGDLLEMAQDIILQSFKSIPQKVCVVTILGPQSSGKSTLLNFLFGCSFATSSGRCTRGVYGTYFDFHNSQAVDCDGIFLIDTEGIMANTTEKDKEKRNDFDTRLVLFCLSISDIVIINAKGNLDRTTSQIVSLCSQKLEILIEEQKDPKPYLFLILNQNNSTNMKESAQDIARLRKELDIQADGAKQLGQAYDTEQIKKRQISLIPDDVELTKRKPKKQFNDDCISLQKLIFAHIKKKSDERVIFDKIENKIIKMERMWTTISRFPNLYNSYSKQTRIVIGKLENYNHQMKKQVIEVEMRRILSLFQLGKINRMQTSMEFEKFIEKIKNSKEYIAIFTPDTNELSETSEKRLNEKQKFQNYLQTCKQNIINQCSIIVREKNIKEEVQFGHDQLRALAFQIREQNLPIDEQIQIFQVQFNSICEQIGKLIQIQDQLTDYLKRIKYYYKRELQDGIGLPKFDDQIARRNIRNSIAKFKTDITLKFFYSSENLVQNKFITRSSQPPINILKFGGKGINDAERKYFDLLEYFEQEDYVYGFYIHKKILKDCLNKKIIQRFTKEILLDHGKVKTILLRWFEKIKIDLKKYGFKLESDSKLFIQYFNSFYLGNNFHYDSFEISGKPNYKIDSYSTSILKKKQFENFLNKHKNHNFSCNNLSKRFHEFLDWEKLKDQILKQMNHKQIIKEISFYLNKAINSQFNFLGIHLQNIYELTKQILFPEKFLFFFSSDFEPKFNLSQNYQQIHSYEFLLKKIKSFEFLHSNFLQNNLIREIFDVKQSFHCVGFCNSRQMLPKKKYKQLLSIFCVQSQKQLVQNIKDERITTFVTNQLVNRRKIEQFLNKIDFFINDQFKNGRNDITQKIARNIYEKIKKEIWKFNLDLNLAGRRLEQLFIGYIHLYAILMLWKNSSNELYEKRMKVYQDFIEKKEKQKKLFLDYASNNINVHSQAQAKLLFEDFKNYFETSVNVYKNELIQKKTANFKRNYPLKFVIDKMDTDYLNINENQGSKQKNKKVSSADNALYNMEQYIKNPFSVIGSYFIELYEQSSKSLQNDTEQIIKLGQNESLKLLENIKILLSNLYEKLSKKKQKELEWSNLFDTKVKIQGAKEDVPKCLMRYFIDLMIGRQANEYNTQKVQCTIPSEKKIRFEDKLCKNKDIFNFLKTINGKHEISNLLVFVHHLISIFQDNTEELKGLFNMTDEELTKHKKQIQVKFCDQKCPCCGRICGVIHENEGKYHECKYGHQIRAFGGMKFQSGLPSTKRCEQLAENDEILYNGEKISWTAFKTKVKGNRNWIYDDCKDPNLYKAQFFEKAWKIYGPKFCQNYQNSKGQKEEMRYISLEQAKKQNTSQSSNGKPNHYIIILDQSGSMTESCGEKTRWDALILALFKLVSELKKKNQKNETRVSLLLMDHNCTVHQENAKMQEINLLFEQSIGGTNFQKTFKQINRISQKYYKQNNIGVIFMTDGECSFPENEAKRLSLLQKQAKKNNTKIVFQGIQFKSNSDTMKKLGAALNGKIRQPKSPVELMEAFKNAVEIFND